MIESGQSEDKNSRRRWHSKVRTGCGACKIRRIKCDETKPRCFQCLRSNKQCDYKTPTPKIFELSTGPKFDSPSEQQSFAYFVQQGAQIVATFLPSSKPFWCHIGPRISHDYPSVKYGITAVGAIQGPLHHSSPKKITTSRQPAQTPMSLTNLAKGMHLASIADPKATPLEATLASCILFTAATIWTEKVGAPSVHAAAAHQIIAEYDRGEYDGVVANRAEIETVFKPLFQRLTVAACTFGDGFPRPGSGIPENYCLDIDLDQAGALSTIEEAFESVGTLLKCVLRLREGITVDGILPRVSVALARCEDALTTLYLQQLDKPPSNTGNTFDHDYRHLRMHLSTIRILFETVHATTEREHDAYRKEFLFILVESKKLLDDLLTSTATTKSAQASALRTTNGMIPPLFFTATRCRDLQIRRHAVALLHSYLHAERGWTSCMAVALANFVIESEHAHSPDGGLHEVATRRIRLEHVSFSSAKKTAYIEYWDCTAAAAASSTTPLFRSPASSILTTTTHTLVDDVIPSMTVGRPMLNHATIPYRPCPAVERDGVTNGMDRKVLHAFGYTGIVLFVPRIECHCC